MSVEFCMESCKNHINRYVPKKTFSKDTDDEIYVRFKFFHNQISRTFRVSILTFFYYSFLFYDLKIIIFLLKQILFITSYFCLDAYILMTENVENGKTFGELKSKYEIKWQIKYK